MLNTSSRVVFNNFGALSAKMIANAQTQVRQTAQAIEQQAKARTRVRTGIMRSSWQHRMTGPASASVYNTDFKVWWHENGTRYMSAQPMATPAAEGERVRFLAGMRNLL